MIQLDPGTEQLLQYAIMIALLLLLPVAVGAVVVLFKLAFLIHSAQDLVRVVFYELTPLMQELRHLADHLETIGGRAASGVEGLGQGIRQTGPAVRRTLEHTRAGAMALASGLVRTFSTKSQV